MTLNELMTKQAILMDRIKRRSETTGSISDNMLALVVELAELANEEQSFKFWKQNKKVVRSKLIEEYVDVLFFWLQLGILLDIPADAITKEYDRKFQVNMRRQDEGY